MYKNAKKPLAMFYGNLENIFRELLTYCTVYGIIFMLSAANALTAKDMRGSGRLLAVCQVISVEYVRFQTGRLG